jgi:hypothetical protein
MDASKEQIARNEVLFREVNERIREVSGQLEGPRDSTLVFVCECGQADCANKIELTRPQYEAVRANPTHFAVLPGHEDPRIATIVERHQGFLIAEKRAEAAELAIEHDPRS